MFSYHHFISLPDIMRKLGDDYLRHEFKQHKNAKPEHIDKFFKAWDDYLLNLRKSEQRFGKDMDNSMKEALSPGQNSKLEELKMETILSLKNNSDLR